MVLLAIFIAVVALTQLFLTGLRVGPVALNFVLVPIVIGGILLGPSKGGILGLVFGAIVIYNGIINPATITGVMLWSSWQTAVTVIIAWLFRGFAVGFFSALIYKALRKKDSIGVIAASVAAPIINTSIFIVSMFIFGNLFMRTNVFPADFEIERSLIYLITAIIGINFLIEFLISMALSPTVYHFITAAKKGKLNG